MNNIIIGTGSYENIAFGNTVSITGDGGNAWGYFGPAYKKLAPRLETYLKYHEGYLNLIANEEVLKMNNLYDIERKKIEDEYIKSYYETRLKDLDIKKLLISLEEKFGDKIILLCHENISEFCHRRVLADYLELETGIYLPELMIKEDGTIKNLEPIRYKKRLEKIIK